MTVALYIRVSTHEQAEEGYSIGEQTERLKMYVKSHDWKIYKIYTDPGFTGSNMDRPALQQMLQDAKNKMFQMVIVYKLDRLSRSQKDTLTIIEEKLLPNGCDFVSMSENFDTSTPFGKAMIGLLAVFAQLEREQIKERMLMGRLARAKDGKYHGGNVAPFGYDYIDSTLLINDYEAMIVRYIYDLAQEGKASNTIIKKINDKYNCKLSQTTVNRIISSPLYKGYVQFMGKYYPGEHEPIISDEQFESVQELIHKRKEDYKLKKIKPGNIGTCLSGLIFCARCGNKYYKNCTSTVIDGKRYSYERYSCAARFTRGKIKYTGIQCDNKHWKIDKLTNIIFDELKKLSLDPESVKNLNQNFVIEKNNSESIALAISKIDAQISKLIDLYTIDSMPADVLQSKIKDLEEKKKSLEEDLKSFEQNKVNKFNIKEAQKIVKKIPDILENGTIEEIHEVLSQLIDKIVIDGEDIAIYWNF